MPIDHPSDLPDDDRPWAGDPGQAADETRPAADETRQSPHEAEPGIHAGQQGEHPTDSEDRHSPDSSHAAGDPASPADPADRSMDRRREDSPTEGGTPDSKEPPPAEARTRQEHADTTPADRSGGALELSGNAVDGQTEGREQVSSNEAWGELHQALEAQPAPDKMPPDTVSEDSPDNPANEETQYPAGDEAQPAEELDPGTDAEPVNPPDSSGDDDLATLAAPSPEAPAPQVEESDNDVGPEPMPVTDSEPTNDMGPGAETAAGSEPTEFGSTPEADTLISALTDKEWAEHVVEVRDKLEKAHSDGLATDHVYTIDPDREQWTSERDKVHGEIVRYFYDRAAEVPCEHRAIVAGGLGGAGKTTVLTEQAEINLAEYLTINPDNIKEELARRNLIPNIEGLSPMEAADLVHEEASAIAKQLARLAQSDGRNVIWDITMSSLESTQRRIDSLRSAGYSNVDGFFVDIPLETSVRRTQFRHREGHEKYRLGEGSGGRYVPPEVIREQADQDWGSKNRRTFEIMKKSFNSWRLYDNSIDGRRAVLLEWSP
jgi:predicted kinase